MRWGATAPGMSARSVLESARRQPWRCYMLLPAPLLLILGSPPFTSNFLESEFHHLQGAKEEF